MNHAALVELIKQHLLDMYDEDGNVCTCRDAKGVSSVDYANHLATLICRLEEQR